MSAGVLRVTSPHRAFRRAGLVFGPEPRVLSAEELTPVQVLSILDEPMLVSEISDDAETWRTPSADFRLGIAEIARATIGMTGDQIRAAFADGTLNASELVERAMLGLPATAPIGGLDLDAELANRRALAEGMVAGAEPGRGAGADHPGSSADVVPQPVIDPNPALPASGGTSDAGVAVRAAPGVATDVIDQPEPPAELAADAAAGLVAPAEPVAAATTKPKRARPPRD
jgi:hypothetical protein